MWVWKFVVYGFFVRNGCVRRLMYVSVSTTSAVRAPTIYWTECFISHFSFIFVSFRYRSARYRNRYLRFTIKRGITPNHWTTDRNLSKKQTRPDVFEQAADFS